MPKSKIAISIDDGVLQKIDALVNSKHFANRSQAIQNAVQAAISKMERSRLAKECAKLDPDEEKVHAEEWFDSELEEWPEY